jgi:rhodanese-related sulfurtransferase
MGTDCGRQILHPNIWVNATIEPYKQQIRWINADSDNKNKFNDWVISDVRFPNEVEAMEELGGIAIRIERDSIIPSDKEHESETALDNYPFTYVLKNNGTKEELLEEIYKIYKNKYQ